MKINQLDQNEIESKYIWNMCKSNINTIQRFRWFCNRLFPGINGFFDIRYWMALPNNQFFGIASARFLLFLFISDENFNINPIKNSLYQKHAPYSGYFSSCFYDDSIFVLEQEHEDSSSIDSFKRYIISQNKWMN
ncbi:unnamed protein product [Blepharisma stoltei]|uniref:Uncharacterized protein n=1 Tax=Blepharisma stoltei TaxID=1481888 RepID=A0AAU9INH9_9CILI|nr:unnamed protein product [Blepharisma stoltei]